MWPAAAASLALLGLSACTLHVQNRDAVREVARPVVAPGVLYAGWRVYEGQCAGCHGADARGGKVAPELLSRVAGMGPRQFAGLVLRRYAWFAPEAREGRVDEPEALLDDIMVHKERALSMPAWQDEPEVSAHIGDLYEYLAARAEGTLGPGRPPR